MAGNELGEPVSNGIPPIEMDELIKYSSRPCSRVRLFYKAKLSLPLEMVGDGFLRQDSERFYVLFDWQPDESRYLKSGEIIGIQTEGRIDFQPRRLKL